MADDAEALRRQFNNVLEDLAAIGDTEYQKRVWGNPQHRSWETFGETMSSLFGSGNALELVDLLPSALHLDPVMAARLKAVLLRLAEFCGKRQPIIEVTYGSLERDAEWAKLSQEAAQLVADLMPSA